MGSRCTRPRLDNDAIQRLQYRAIGMFDFAFARAMMRTGPATRTLVAGLVIGV